MEEQKAETTKEETKVLPEAVKDAVVKEPQSLEEAKEVIEKLKEQLAKPAVEVRQTPPELTPEQKAQREKQMKYFQELSRGAKFIEFIINDLNSAGFNRNKRRRLIKELFNKRFSKEFVFSYIDKLDQILEFLRQELTITAGEDIKKGDIIEIEKSKVFVKKEPVDAKELLKKFEDSQEKEPTTGETINPEQEAKPEPQENKNV